MRYYTWDGFRLFQSLRRAADVCRREDLNPFDLSVLVDGRLELADDWEVDELLQLGFGCTQSEVFA